MTPTEKRERFSRLFPARVTKIRDQLRILGNCSNKGSYDWDQPKVNMFFALILQEFITLAKSFGVQVSAQVDARDVREFEYIPPTSSQP